MGDLPPHLHEGEHYDEEQRTALCKCLKAQKVIEHPLGNEEQKRKFLLDNLPEFEDWFEKTGTGFELREQARIEDADSIASSDILSASDFPLLHQIDNPEGSSDLKDWVNPEFEQKRRAAQEAQKKGLSGRMFRPGGTPGGTAAGSSADPHSPRPGKRLSLGWGFSWTRLNNLQLDVNNEAKHIVVAVCQTKIEMKIPAPASGGRETSRPVDAVLIKDTNAHPDTEMYFRWLPLEALAAPDVGGDMLSVQALVGDPRKKFMEDLLDTWITKFPNEFQDGVVPQKEL